MQIDSNRLRELRTARHWSQEQVAELSGLNLRTIQRLESGAKVSTESLRALAAVFEVPAESLLLGRAAPGQPAIQAMRDGVLQGLTFTSTTPRATDESRTTKTPPGPRSRIGACRMRPACSHFGDHAERGGRPAANGQLSQPVSGSADTTPP
ncbi:MAG: helix-turn-helix transcriptional regulator [Xanthomonadaceae bacterium]|nr:helix-turn-helix transcriptional regulator [Xanthomonadaceae bacterium]